MNYWHRPPRDEQRQNFELAVCKRLGLNPDEIVQGDITADLLDNGGLSTVTVKVHLPAAELRAMWEAARPAPPPKIADVRKGEVIRLHTVPNGYIDVLVTAGLLEAIAHYPAAPS